MKKHGLALSLDVIAYIIVVLILTALVAVKSSGPLDSARSDKAYADTANLGALISQYKLEVGTYPTTLSDLTNTEGQYGPWISKIDKDPWGDSYQYKYTDKAFIVYSYGPDKIDNGSSPEEVKNGDIGFIGK